MPVVTAATTPETPSASAGRNAKYALTSEKNDCVAVSLMCSRIRTTTQATIAPIATPPRTSTRNAPAAIDSENVPAVAAPTANLNAMSAVESLMRSEEHTSELQSRQYLVCRLLLEKKKKNTPTPSLSRLRI